MREELKEMKVAVTKVQQMKEEDTKMKELNEGKVPKKEEAIALKKQHKKEGVFVTEKDRKKEEVVEMEGLKKGGEDVEMGEHKMRGKGVEMDEHKKEGEDVETMGSEKNGEDLEMEEVQSTEDDQESNSDDMFIDDSDSEQASASENDDESNSEAPLTDADIEELVAEFLEVESKAAEAQEALEKESLAQVESDVRTELAQNLHGDELELAVSSEMKIFVEEWETVLNDLETESALLLEQLDGAGIELPSLYKYIESQAPNGCCTEAWRQRAHWVGAQVTSELNESVRDAEKSLQSCRPVRRQHGRLLEEGASGFLARKLSIEANRDSLAENSEKDWSSFNEVINSHRCSDSTSFGSKNWASVYLASTPQQAANMGLRLPGIDEVEEIGEIECNSSDPFYVDAIANEKEQDLSEEQKRNFRKVREEDDANITWKLQRRLKRRRHRNKHYRESIQKEIMDNMVLLNECSQPVSGKPSSSGIGVPNVDDNDIYNQKLKSEAVDFDDTGKESLIVNGTCKRVHDNKDTESDNKRCRTVIIDSDDEVQVVEGKSASNISHGPNKGQEAALQVKEVVDIIDVDIIPSPCPSDSRFHPTDNSKNFHCTACSEVLKASEVHKHPLLEVIVCESCKCFVEKKMRLKGLDSLGSYCGWCGKCNDLISCSSCKMLFCAICISRNFGEEHLSESKASGWKCFCCSPILLHQFISECEEALGGLVVCGSDSDSELSDADIGVSVSNKKRRKRRIRRILDDTELGEETKQKIAIEQARQEHLKSMQVQSTGKSCSKNTTTFNGNVTEAVTIEMVGDATNGYIVNVAREEDEEPVRIPPSISTKLKPHQIAGIRFMWENIIQTVRKVKSGDEGLGCILAHTMGLGKTLQVIAFLYTAMRGVDLGLRTALVVTPVNVLHNWRQEFLKWRPVELKPLRVFMLEDVARERRGYLLTKWTAKGGILLIGYTAFRNLCIGRSVKDRNTATEICHALQYGPDVLVCDEAHMIKNTRADITQALKQVRTQRRIALTGSPLQNNLMEYYCMVDFVREGFLGSSHEFRNRFQNPIQNGQHTNSTSDDVKTMNQRSHILYEQLKGFVQRMDMNVVKKDLPPKTVYVISVKLSPLQRKLYKNFLVVHGFTSDKASTDKTMKRSGFFAGYQALAQIWNHPGLLQMAKEHKDSLRREDAVENFLVEDSSSDDNVESGDLLNGEKQRTRNDFMNKKSNGIFYHEEIDWWEDLLDKKIYDEVDYSGKMVLLLDILSMSSEVGDKALVFSQSLTTLDLIELFLSKLPRKGSEGKNWKQGKDWYRLDGSTEGSERQKLVEKFNEPSNRRVKCTLISTRAGALGINLHAANRVIVVDGSWNPTNDLQAIYRVWRYGQNKPVFAYRLMAHGTMEEKIYKRQVTKEGLAARVVDRQQIHRTMSKEEVLHLFDFGDDENVDVVPEQSQENPVSSNQDRTCEVVSLLKQKSLPLSHGASSSDKFMESLLSRHYPRWIANYHEHETLLQENESERLSKEEQDMAWETFQKTLEWEEVHRVSFDDSVSCEKKPAGNVVTPENSVPQQTKGSSRNRPVNQRKCTNLAHLLTLRSQGTKSGFSTVCGECAQEISWENLNRDGKSR